MEPIYRFKNTRDVPLLFAAISSLLLALMSIYLYCDSKKYAYLLLMILFMGAGIGLLFISLMIRKNEFIHVTDYEIFISGGLIRKSRAIHAKQIQEIITNKKGIKVYLKTKRIYKLPLWAIQHVDRHELYTCLTKMKKNGGE